MVERTPIFNIVSQILLFLGLVAALAPFAVVAIAATQDLRTVNLVPMPLIPGRHLWENLTEAWNRVDFGGKMLNSFVFSTGYFRYAGRMLVFWLIFITLMLPLEVRIVPTYAVAANVLGPYQTLLDLTGITWLIQHLA